MTDFHTHILPGMDDGAQDAEQSFKMLSRLSQSGVNQVILTPHFQFGTEDLTGFLERRQAAMGRISCALAQLGMKARLGAEVYLNRRLVQREGVERLCIEGSSSMLLEFSFMKWEEYYLDELEQLRACFDITPIIAHVERYPYFSLPLAGRLVEVGCVLQLNCTAVKTDKRLIKKLVEDGFPVVWGSDCHNLSTRPPVFLTSKDMDKLGLVVNGRLENRLLGE